jgi:uncharacterized membrane protein
MILLYLISIVFAMMSSVTNNLGQLIAAMIIAFVATLVDRVGR